jgi:hypothetical protein
MLRSAQLQSSPRLHLPMQKSQKMASSTSPALTSPAIDPSALSGG